MIELVDRLLMNMDNGLLTGLSLIDFRKAFYLVDHEVLLRKLVVYQIFDFFGYEASEPTLVADVAIVKLLKTEVKISKGQTKLFSPLAPFKPCILSFQLFSGN